MNRFARTALVGGAAGVATWIFGVLLAIALFPIDTVTSGAIVVVNKTVMLGAIAVAVGTGAAWSRVEEGAARPAAWPERPPTVRFSNEEPSTLRWGPGIVSPGTVITGIEGQLLHRRLVLAARELTTGTAEFAPFDRLALSDSGEPFLAVVCCLRGDQKNAPNRWLIIVRDPGRVGDEFSATIPGAAPVTQPAVLAAVVTYKKGLRNWEIGVDELNALDAAYVAGSAVYAWRRVASERDLEIAGARATAKLGRDGIRWSIALHVPTTQRDADDARERLHGLLRELRVPVVVRAVGALRHNDDEGDEDGERHASDAGDGNSHEAAGDRPDDARDDE